MKFLQLSTSTLRMLTSVAGHPTNTTDFQIRKMEYEADCNINWRQIFFSPIDFWFPLVLRLTFKRTLGTVADCCFQLAIYDLGEVGYFPHMTLFYRKSLAWGSIQLNRLPLSHWVRWMTVKSDLWISNELDQSSLCSDSR